jgi:predicted house-cleaning noncanonical NTP pyrophosphatase (MazG superfamily)
MFGDESWEVDALVTKDIKEMQKLLEDAILRILGNDIEKFNQIVNENAKLSEELRNKLKENLGG